MAYCNEAIRKALANRDTLKTILRNDELKTLLKEEDCQDLIRGVHCMVQAGRNHTRHEDFKDHMCILGSVYLNLRSNPTLCHRLTVGVAQQQQESATAEHNAESWVSNDTTQTECGQDDNDRPKRKRKRSVYLRY
jgi:hypothetical protein